ncbi:hypothetical protein [Occallatibacter savannae]|uniref:dioxygenase family protein n=1 Tax=Occallatibacter savannae TaxID=1002691 RepID=UPI0013A5BA09|nr:hypothetical protein [Occallatibacter savannae]
MPGTFKGRIAPSIEPGAQLIITGKVFEADCHTLAAGVTVYSYHTDANGFYRFDHYMPDWQSRRPRLEGTVRTGADGMYEFQTIRPAPYPEHNNPAHVHFVLWWPDGHRQGDIAYFVGDPLLGPSQFRQNASTLNFSSIQHVITDGNMQRLHLDFHKHEQED